MTPRKASITPREALFDRHARTGANKYKVTIPRTIRIDY